MAIPMRGPKRGRNKHELGKARASDKEDKFHLKVGDRKHRFMHDPLEGYTPRPKARVEVWRREK